MSLSYCFQLKKNGSRLNENQEWNNLEYVRQQTFHEGVDEPVIETDNTVGADLTVRGCVCDDNDDFEDLVAIGKQSIESVNHLIAYQLGEHDLHVEENCSVKRSSYIGVNDHLQTPKTK